MVYFLVPRRFVLRPCVTELCFFHNVQNLLEGEELGRAEAKARIVDKDAASIVVQEGIQAAKSVHHAR